MPEFPSPREEAFVLAYDTRKKILNNDLDYIAVIRACYTVSNMLNKDNYIKIFSKELNGYPSKDVVPRYRKIWTKYESGDIKTWDYYEFRDSVYELYYYNFEYSYQILDDEKTWSINKRVKDTFFSHLIDDCLIFLTQIINELQYGGTVEFLMEEIRKNTDEKLYNLDGKIKDETNSLYLNLNSTNPADWIKVGHSSRRLLKIVADKIFPPNQENYKLKDGRELLIGENHVINRLCAFVDNKLQGEERKFTISELQYFEQYLRQIVEYNQMGEHAPSIEKYDANMIAIHTYLILSNILQFIPGATDNNVSKP